ADPDQVLFRRQPGLAGLLILLHDLSLSPRIGARLRLIQRLLSLAQETLLLIMEVDGFPPALRVFRGEALDRQILRNLATEGPSVSLIQNFQRPLRTFPMDIDYGMESREAIEIDSHGQSILGVRGINAPSRQTLKPLRN